MTLYFYFYFLDIIIDDYCLFFFKKKKIDLFTQKHKKDIKMHAALMKKQNPLSFTIHRQNINKKFIMMFRQQINATE